MLYSLLSTIGLSLSVESIDDINQKVRKNTGPFFEIHWFFEADACSVFRMWIDPDRFASWMGPEGAKMNFITTDVTEGGKSLWSMTTDGMTKYGQICFNSILPDNLLVYTQNFCNENGSFAKAPFSDSYPDYLQTTVSFTAEEERITKVHVKWEVKGRYTAIEKQTFEDMIDVMKAGWSDSFRKLEELLKSQKHSLR